MEKEFREIEVDRLQPHPKNEQIYGLDEDVTDLKEQIQAVGNKILDTLKVTKEHVIISGHRRWKAARELGLTRVPCEIVSFDSEDEELAALVLFNSKRTKTNEQKAREGIALFDTISEEALERRLAALNQNRADMDDSSTTEESEVGLTRDKVAKAVGINSGRTFDRMKAVLTKVDELRETGNIDDSELFIAVLNRRPSAASDLINVSLESLTEEDRENIRTGKVAPRAFLPPKEKIKDKQNQKKHTSYAEAVAETKALGKSIKKLTKLADNITGLEKQDKICKSLEVHIKSIQELLSTIKCRQKASASPDSFTFKPHINNW